MTAAKIKHLSQLKRILPRDEVSFETAVLEKHAGDKWFAAHKPDVVVLPRSTKSVSALLRFAHQYHIPVTPRGAGHGYVGGCVPVQGGIVLSFERMNRIKEINGADFIAIVQAGVITKDLQDAVEEKGLYYPPDPASRAESFIGGNIATNAGGPRCLKYGVTRDYILGLEAVLANGDVVQVGGRTHKNKTGFDFTRLFVGSEGLLAVVTEATLKLLPLPPFRASLAVGFGSMRPAIRALQAILAAGFLPCALEVADAFTLAAAFNRTKSPRLRGCGAHLIVELDGQESSVRSEVRHVERIVRHQKPLFVERGLGDHQCEEIWKIRREFSYSLRDTGLTKLNQDIVVPRGRLADLFSFAARLQEKHSLPIACFGHAGDGNIHVNVMVDFKEPRAAHRADAALDELFRRVLEWKGAITGEHGIGLAKKAWWRLAVSKEVRKLHGAVKKALDPHGILNPGKFV
jgi:glycolate dehydrogenase FAD-linked subunit